jgi:hypothetical protein
VNDGLTVGNPSLRTGAFSQRTSAITAVNPEAEADIIFPRSAIAGRAKSLNVANGGPIPSTEATPVIWPKKSSAKSAINSGSEGDIIFPRSARLLNASDAVRVPSTVPAPFTWSPKKSSVVNPQTKARRYPKFIIPEPENELPVNTDSEVRHPQSAGSESEIPKTSKDDENEGIRFESTTSGSHGSSNPDETEAQVVYRIRSNLLTR